ncbi:MAG: BON domain-containing protein [Planctomycetota bacterium]|nr:BON domain-containing protein [Planctomycetota bacterium]
MKPISIPAMILCLFCFAESSNAQLFGTRSIKRSMSRQNVSRAGQIQGNERFLRSQRRQNFVGSEQGRTSGRIASPTGGIRKFSDRTDQINKPVPALKKKELYPAKIILPSSFFSNRQTPAQNLAKGVQLTDAFREKINDSIEVSVEGRSATLRGVVSSSREKSIAELLLHFEPGIDEIQNEISISAR